MGKGRVQLGSGQRPIQGIAQNAQHRMCTSTLEDVRVDRTEHKRDRAQWTIQHMKTLQPLSSPIAGWMKGSISGERHCISGERHCISGERHCNNLLP
jgi:hypothetical protein